MHYNRGRKEAQTPMKSNMVIRSASKSAGVRLWQIAEALGIQETALSRKLRHELPTEEKNKILGIIEALAQERQEVG